MPDLSESAKNIITKRYLIKGQETTWEECAGRSGIEVASAEPKENSTWADLFSEMIFNLDFLPAGRILRNAGRTRGSMFNCYVLPYGDSIKEIGEFNANALELWADGGGVGTNSSFLRPRGAPIMGRGGNSSGPVSFLRYSNAGANTIESGGQRRAAALSMMSVSHPDIFNFMDAKLVDKVLDAFNISVAVTEKFLAAVETNSSWELKFNNQVAKTIQARTLWNKLIKNMIDCAEPGIINWDKLRENNSYYFAPIYATNPCGEAPMEPYGVCCLGSIVLPNFIKGSSSTNWAKLGQTIKLAVRFLDNVIDVNKYSLEQIERRAKEGRRIGLGVMGLAQYLFAKQIEYGSPRAVRETERLMRFIRDNVYQSLVELSSEKGSFPKFDSQAYSKAKFIRTLPASLRMDIKEYGSRCVTGMAIAPTGTISLIPEVQSGIEPLYLGAYKRNDKLGERVYIHPTYRKAILENNGELPDWFVDTSSLEPSDHLEMQVVVQKYVDGAVSKTINLPSGFKPANLNKLLLEYIYDIKGCAVYVDGSREGQVLNKITEEEALENIKLAGAWEDADPGCATGTCEI
jgi:ribonucleoside-diphosphate reductase alpha chain